MKLVPNGPGPHRNTRTPKYRAPAGATDCHAHIFDPAHFPYSPDTFYAPETSDARDYDRMLAAIGFARAALVHTGAYGNDNRVTLDAISRHRDSFRGVAIVPPELPSDQLAALHAGGMRGSRFSTIEGVGFSQLARVAGETHELGWHVVLHFRNAAELLDIEPVLERIRNPFVLDHLARITAAEGVASEPFGALLRLLDTDRCYVKLASIYRLSSEPYPYRDMLPMIHAVVARRPDRIIWGSNWPHPVHTHSPIPNDGDMVDLIPLWVPDPAGQRRMLVDNPAALYGFPAAI
jgi:2-pyrone-4,6-dicarboxylate lactonase